MNGRSETFYVCDVVGNTWPIKAELKKEGFRWDAGMKHWTAIGLSERERALFTMKVQTGAWGKVTLKFHSMQSQETPF